MKERKQFGKAIAEFQGVQFQLARDGDRVEAARLLVYNAARLRTPGSRSSPKRRCARSYSSEVAERVASMAVNLFGGYGFVEGLPGREAVPRREDRSDLRGHVEHAAAAAL